MRVVHFMSRFRLEDGGVVRAVLDICAVLAQRGMDLTIITWDAADLPEAWKRDEPGCPKIVQVVSPTRPGGFLDRDVLAQIEEVLRNADVLHLHTPWERANLQLSRVAQRVGCPYVLTIHGMLDDWSMSQKGFKKRVYLMLGARRMLERAAFVHCTARGELEQAQRWFPRGTGCVVPLIFDLAPFRNPPGPELARREIPAADTDDPIVLFLSRVHYKKQPEVLIDAAAMLRDDGVAFRVIIAGTGEEDYMDSLRERVKKRGLNDRVFLVGMIVGDVKVSLFQAADVFVLPTSQENFGFVLTEALACATPVITTRGTDIWPELEACGGALIIEGEPHATAEAVARLLKDPEQARTMGRDGRAWVMEALDPETIAREFEQMYRDAAKTDR